VVVVVQDEKKKEMERGRRGTGLVREDGCWAWAAGGRGQGEREGQERRVGLEVDFYFKSSFPFSFFSKLFYKLI
jgi:hypothetical protein